MSEKWSLFKKNVLDKDFLKKMPKIGPYLVLILSKSPYFKKSSSEKEILCHLDNKISAQMYIQTGHCRFCGLFGLKLEKMVVGLKSGITLSCASTPERQSLCGDTGRSLFSGFMVLIWYLFF